MTHKQVIVVRKDLKMGKGKMVSQGAHASLKAILDTGHVEGVVDSWKNQFVIPLEVRITAWLTGNFKKACVYVTSEEELLALHEKAKELGIITALITDSGLTEFHGVPTNTCIAVGPDTEENVNKVTGHLPLL
jgi:PTH2 family peptidyl-tRNA hydrolase